jgi:hypothetical protein
MGQFTEQRAIEQFFKNLFISLLQNMPRWEILLSAIKALTCLSVFYLSGNVQSGVKLEPGHALG